MSQTPRYLLHLGLAKTASTYLQRDVFPFCNQINYLGKPFWTRRKAIRKMIAGWARGRFSFHPPLDQFVKNEIRLRQEELRDDDSAIMSIRSQILKASKLNMLNLLSHEGFIRPTRKESLLCRRIALENLKRILGHSSDIDVLIVLRQPKSLIRSYTIQFWEELCHFGWEETPASEIMRTRSGPAWDNWYSYFDHVGLIEDLTDVFGQKSVHVLWYEEFRDDPLVLQKVLRVLDDSIELSFPIRHRRVTNDKPVPKNSKLHGYLKDLDTIDCYDVFERVGPVRSG